MAAGDIGSSYIDALEFGASNGTSNLVHISGDVYAGCYSDGYGDGHVFTIAIDEDGNIGSSVIEDFEFETDIATYPQIVRIKTTNYFIITYRGPNDDGFMKTIYISDAGDIASAVTDTWEFDADTCKGMCKVRHVNGTIYMMAYSGIDDDLQVITFEISDTGDIDSTGVIDQVELGGSNSPNLQPGVELHYDDGSTVIFAIAFTDDEADTDGYISTVQISYDGTIASEIATLEFNTSQAVHISMCKVFSTGWHNWYAISYSGVDGDCFVTTVIISNDGLTLTLKSTLEADADYGAYTDIQRIGDSVVANVFVSQESSTTCTLKTYSIGLNGEIAALDSIDFESTYGTTPFLNKIENSNNIWAIFYVGGSSELNTIKTYEIEIPYFRFGFPLLEGEAGTGSLQESRRGCAATPEFSGNLVSLVARVYNLSVSHDITCSIWKESDKTLIAYKEVTGVSHSGDAWVKFALNGEAIEAGISYILAVHATSGNFSNIRYANVADYAPYYYQSLTYTNSPTSPWSGYTYTQFLTRQYEIYCNYTMTSEAVTVSMNPATLASSAQSLSVAAGATVNMNAATLASSVNALSLMPGAVTISISPSTLVTGAQSLSMAVGGVTIPVNALTIASGVQSLGVSPGAVALLVDALSLTAAAQSLDVSTATMVAMNAASLTAAAQNLTVSPSEAILAMNAATIASSTQNLTVALGTLPVTIAMDALSMIASAAQVTLAPAAVSIAMDALTIASAAQDLTLYALTTININPATMTLTPVSTTIIPGGTTIGVNPASIISSAQNLSVFLAGAPVTINMDPAIIASSVGNLTMYALTTINMDALSMAVAAQNLSTAVGASSILLSPAALTITPMDLFIIGGIVILPDGRGIIVAAEDRNVIIATEDRIIGV